MDTGGIYRKSPYILIFLFLSLAPLKIQAQQNNTVAQKRWGLSAGYFGETITHYGLKIGIERPFYQWQHINSKSRIINKELIGSLNIGAYRHPYNHYGLMAQTEWGIRRTKPRGSLFEVGLSVGCLRTILDGETYEVEPNGSLRRLTLAGRNALLGGVYTSWGQDLSQTIHLPLLWRVKPSLLIQTPYNTSILPRLNLELGIIYKLK